MKKLLVVLIAFFLNFYVFGQETNRWFIEKRHNRVGFIDSTGKEVFTGKFTFLDNEFNSGLVFFKKGNQTGFLDSMGKVVFTEKSLWGSYSEGILAYRNQTGFYYLNSYGKRAISLQNLPMPEGKEVSKIFDFEEGLALIRIKDRGFDDSNHVPSDIVFPEDYNLYPGNWLFGFINKKGEWVINPILQSANSFKDGITIVEKEGTKYFMNLRGDIITEISHRGVGDYSEGFAVVYSDKGYYFIDVHNNRLGTLAFDQASPFSDGMASVKINGKWGFINTNGQIVIEPKYYIKSDFKEGLAPVSIEVAPPNKRSHFVEAFIDKSGNEVIPFEKDTDYGNLNNGIAQGRRFIHSYDDRYTGYYELFYINREGRKIWSEIVKQ